MKDKIIFKTLMLKGDAGEPTAEQTQSAVNEYMQQHPEAAIDETIINSAVSDWLDDHPEATTTVNFNTAYKAHNSVSDMVSDLNLHDGDNVKTNNYYQDNNGGGGWYKIRNKLSGDIIDNGRIIALANTDLVAELIPSKNTVDVMQFGAYCDGVHDDTNALKNAIYAMGIVSDYSIPRILYIPSKLRITERIYVNRQAFVLKGNHPTGSRIICDGNDTGLHYKIDDTTIYELQFEDISIVGNESNTEPVLILDGCYNLYFNRCYFGKVGSDVYTIKIKSNSGIVWFTECTFDGAATVDGTRNGVLIDGGLGSIISFSKSNIWNLNNFIKITGGINALNFYDNWMENVKSAFVLDESNITSANIELNIFANVISTHNHADFVITTYNFITIIGSSTTNLDGSAINVKDNIIYLWDLTGVVNNSLINIEGGLVSGGLVDIVYKNNRYTGKKPANINAYVYKNNIAANWFTVRIIDASVMTSYEETNICDDLTLVHAPIASKASHSQWSPRGINVNTAVPSGQNDGRIYYANGVFYAGYSGTIKSVPEASNVTIPNSTAANLATLVSDFNTLVAALKTSRVIK